MKLIFIRHAHAEGHHLEDPDQDFIRELTLKGIKRFQKTFPLMAKALPSPHVIFTSPLYRSLQTAELVADSWPEADLEMISDLHTLDDPRHLVEYISFLPMEGTYAFIGHEPHLSSVIGLLLGLHPEHSFMNFKKGGVCLVEGSMWDGLEMKLLLSPQMVEDIKGE